MRYKITAFLCAFFLICGSGVINAAAAESLGVSVKMGSSGKKADITLEQVSTQVYGVQLTLQTGLKASAFTFTSDVKDAYTVVKDGDASGEVIVYLDAKRVLNKSGKITLGSLSADKKFTIGRSADLILVDRSLVGTEYEKVPVTVTDKETINSGSSSGSSSGDRNDNTNTVIKPSPSPAPVNTADKFTDISDHWAKSAVAFVTAQGLFQGTSETEFMPDSEMTRAMFVTVLQRFGTAVNAKWKLQSSNSLSFADVPAGEWYTDAVAWASGTGVVNGIGDGMFAPNDAVTREQMAVMIVRFASLCGVELPAVTEPAEFTDAAQIQDWAADAVVKAQKAGIIQGRPEGNFDPQATATRAEVAAIMQRLVENTK